MTDHKGYRIKVPHFYCLEYYEDDKKLIVEIDFREEYFVLKPQLITRWEKPYENIDIGIDEKKRILLNIREFLLTKTTPNNIIMVGFTSREGITMWREKLKEIKVIFGEKVNSGALEKEIKAFNKIVAKELNVNLPDDYIKVLKIVNGIEFNGHILYGIDEELLADRPNQHINGLVENNKIWHDNEWQKQYIFLGESDISWYVFDLLTKKYCELDNPSGTVCEEFSDFESMVEKMLSEALM